MTDHDVLMRLRRDKGTQGDRNRKRGIVRFFRDLLVIFFVALLISFLIKTFLIRSFYIPSGSMENTLQVNDRIMVNELVPDLITIARGDVIVFTDPGGWLSATEQGTVEAGNPVADGIRWFFAEVGLSAQETNDHLIKRVIGLPGDKVACCDTTGHITVNDAPLSEPYLKASSGTTRSPEKYFTVTVPADSLWVEGDNRDNSADSRLHTTTPSKGFVPMANVVGRAFVITWPVGHWSWLDNYPNTFRGTSQDR